MKKSSPELRLRFPHSRESSQPPDPLIPPPPPNDIVSTSMAPPPVPQWSWDDMDLVLHPPASQPNTAPPPSSDIHVVPPPTYATHHPEVHSTQAFRPPAIEDMVNVPPTQMLSRQRVKILLSNQARHPGFLCRTCPHCDTKLLNDENDSWCCGMTCRGSQRRHVMWPDLPQRMHDLMASESKFSDLSRIFNSLFCSAVLHSDIGEAGLNYHHRGGPPCMRFSGHLYARMMRTSSNCWFLCDSKFGKGYEMLTYPQKASALQIALVLRESNPLAHRMWNVGSHVNRPEMVSSHRVHDGVVAFAESEMTSTVCAVYLGPGGLPPARFIVNAYLGSRQQLDENNPLWEVLLYPLMHPTGSTATTWRPALKSQDGRSTLRLLQYLRSVMIHEKNFWKFGRLAHQFILDTFARNEQINMATWKSAAVQGRIRQAIQAMNGRIVEDGKIFLPASVPGSMNYQRRFMHDALHITAMNGNPHLFITMTANVNWPEIIALLPVGQRASDRPDIVCRVFNQKRKELMWLLQQKDSLFPGHNGVIFVISVTEWQLCGLPHVHIAIRLDINTSIVPMTTVHDQLQLMSKVVSAQLPPVGTTDFDLVNTFMMHGAVCDARCQRKRKNGTFGCRFFYPKPVNEYARMDRKGYPVYVRTERDGRVVPHNLFILRKMMCHINFEWTLGSGCIAYLYKYFSKGVDSTGVRISESDDEIAAFRKARVMTASEAVYRTFQYKVNFRDPSVILCRFSVPDRRSAREQPIQNFLAGEPDELMAEMGIDPPSGTEENLVGDLQDYFNRPVLDDQNDETTFTDFFARWYRPANTDRISFSLRQHAKLDLLNRYWVQRKPNANVLARMHYVPKYAGEAYYLRLLLLHLPARSYEDLYGTHRTFRDRAEAEGFVHTSIQNVHALLEAISEGTTSAAFRRLYVMMILNCGEMGGTWEVGPVRKLLIHDFQPDIRSQQDWSEDIASQLCIMDLVLIADSMGRMISLSDNGIPAPTKTLEHLLELQTQVGSTHTTLKAFAEFTGVNLSTQSRVNDYGSEIRRHFQQSPVLPPPALETRILSLNEEQRPVFDRVAACLERNEVFRFHVDAAAGCGKTFLCQTLLHLLRSMDKIGLCCATTGIAALQYDSGRTAHSLFQLPLTEEKDIIEGSTMDSRLMQILADGKTNVRIELLRKASVIVWDEIGMCHRMLYEAVDRLLRAIMGTPNSPFGGKNMITLGDWRQICPVDSDAPSRFVSRDDKQAFASSAFKSSILSSPLWGSFAVCPLTLNERCKKKSVSANEAPDEEIRCHENTEYHNTLMRIGNGVGGDDLAISSISNLKTTTSFENAIDWLHNEKGSLSFDPVLIASRAFIAPFNADVDIVNEWCTTRMSAATKMECVKLLSVDSFDSPDSIPVVQMPDATPADPLDEHIVMAEERLNADDIRFANAEDMDGEMENTNETLDFQDTVSRQHLQSDTFTTEVLHHQNFPGVPPHVLTIGVGMVVVLLRNMDHSKHLLNGSRMVVVRIRKNVIIVRHVCDTSKVKKEEEFVIPRIRFSLSVGGIDAKVIRMQFPVRPAFAITIHKSQACTLGRTVVDLRSGVFDHGQLYVALSRVRSPNDLLLLINPDQLHIKNIVHEILLRIGGVLPDR